MPVFSQVLVAAGEELDVGRIARLSGVGGLQARILDAEDMEFDLEANHQFMAF